MKRGKKYLERLKGVDKDKVYSLSEAIDVLKAYSPIGFDETLDAGGRLGADPKNSEQAIRGAVVLPHGTGKASRVLVFCEPARENEAKEAGADYIGSDEIIEQITKKGWSDFDSCISTPAMMKTVSRLGKFLGPRGLMPSPKTGTVTDNVVTAISEAKKGKVSFRMDKIGCIHAGLGKLSFEKKKLIDNTEAFILALKAARPQSIKGQFIKSFYLSTTMGPSVKVNAA